MSESLTPDVVTAWRRRAGVSETPGPNPTRRLHRVGAAGLAEYLPALEVTPLTDVEWEEYAYWRPYRCSWRSRCCGRRVRPRGPSDSSATTLRIS